MADKISVEIDLEGGAEVTKQLDEIGKAGQQAFSDIQSAAEQVNLDSATAQFDDLGGAGQAAFQKIKSAAQNAVVAENIIQGVAKVQGAFDTLGDAAVRMGARLTRALGPIGVIARALGPIGIALGVAGGAFLKFGDDAADGINALTAAGARLGQTPQQLDKLQKALAQAGASPDAITSGLAKLKETLSGDFFPQDLTTGLQNFISRLETMPDSVERTQLAMQTLDEGLGAQVIAGLQTGAITAENFKQALAGISPVTQQQIVDAAKYQQALNQLSQVWTELKGAFAPIATPIFEFLTEQVRKFIEDLKQLRLEIAFVKGVWDVFKAGITGQDMGEAARKAVEEYRKLEEQLRQTAVAAGTGAATQDVAALGNAAGQTSQQLAQMGLAGATAGDQTSSSMNSATQSMGNFIITTQQGLVVLTNITEAAARAAQFIANLPRPTSIPLLSQSRPDPIGHGFASGGLLGGHGTGTSDSNLAWVSRGEHIMPARAVSQPGVLSFLEALRRSGGNLRGILDGMGRFALGGLVPRQSFATGGPVGGSMSNVTINFPGTPPINGLRASVDVVDQLQRAAALAQVRSGGRKPSRYS